MNEMNILITGANGFVGSHLCRTLTERGYYVRAAIRRIDRRCSVNAHDVVEIGDIGWATDWSVALKDIDMVIHLAARAHVMKERHSDPLEEYRRINVGGTACLVKACVNASVKRMVYLSSIGVNGDYSLDRVFTEDDEPAPNTPYAVSKHEAEKALGDLAEGTRLEYTIIRSPLVYGERAPGNMLRLLNSIDKGYPLPLAGINNLRSLISVGNLVDFIRLCAIHPGASNQLFLVSDGEDVSTTELVRRLSEGMSKKIILFRVPLGILKGALKIVGRSDIAGKLYASLQVDSTKAKSLLGWRPPYSMDEALESMAQCYLSTSH